jgi:shikimate kinase
MRIYLVGYMASGKSNLGRLLAGKLGYEFLDLDYLFEERYRISIPDFFEKYDEAAFREIERKLLRETIEMEDVVVSTGGGTPCFFDNMLFIKQAGLSVYLCWKVPALVRRLKMVKLKRPLLKNIPPEELERHVAGQLHRREVFYTQADFVIQGEGIDLDDLLHTLRNRILNA